MKIEDTIHVDGLSLILDLNYKSQESTCKEVTINDTDRMITELSDLTGYKFQKYMTGTPIPEEIPIGNKGLELNVSKAKLLYKSMNNSPSSVSLEFYDNTKVESTHGTITENDIKRQLLIGIKINDPETYNSMKLKQESMELLGKIDRYANKLKNYVCK
jgi:hypothetical protein